MHNLGNTRSSQQPNHLLLTPDTFVRTTLPGMKDCAAIVHVGSALGARFTQYTAEFEVGGEMVGTRAQRFIFVMDGEVRLETPEKQKKLGERGYAYVPPGLTHRITST
ncbi:MAG: cupin domain-containing protein, partial [Terriglobales bacterium]